MKKVYLLALTVYAAGALNAQVSNPQGEHAGAKKLAFTAPNNIEDRPMAEDRAGGDIIWEDGFEDPANWIATGPSGDYDEWGWSIGSETNDWYGFDADMGTSGNFARFRNGDPTGSPDPIEDAPFTLEFDGSLDLTGIPAPHIEWEQYGARFITTQEIQVSIDGGTEWITVGSNDDIPPLTIDGGDVYAKPQTRRFPIHCAIADDPSNVMIRLYWADAVNGPSANYVDYGWFVDDVRIVEGFSYDIQNDATYHRSGVDGPAFVEGLEYYMIPESQITEIEFSGWGSNNGGADHTGAKLNIEVEKSGSVYTGSTTPVDLAVCDSDSLSGAAAFTPADGLGTYNITYTFDGDNPDDVTDNDVSTDAIEVTELTYGRDNGVATGGINSVTSSPEGVMTIGNIMEVFGNAEIGAIDVFISAGAENDQVYGDVYIYDDGAGDWVYQNTTDEYELQPGDVGGFVKLYFTDDAVVVSEGDVILITAGHYGGPTPPTFGMAQPVMEGTVQGYIDGSGFQLITPDAIMIRADLQNYVSIDEKTNSNLTVGQNVPNPFDVNSSITYSLEEAANVTVQFVDASGRVVLDINKGNQAAGEHKLNLNAADFSEGIYFYTFTVGETKITKRMVVTK
ncbi:MAG: T9SS type A sorting domain-containing protein [Flavobacteriales bacterium]|nr:T9SS type A sorting domain-containing protein [Flavobacteriales bacterium]